MGDEAAGVMLVPFDQEVIDNLRPPAAWGKNSARRPLVMLRDDAVPFIVGDSWEVKILSEGTRQVIGRDCTGEQATKWLAAGSAKLLPCFYVRCLVSGWPFGLSASGDRLKRGEVEAQEGSTGSAAASDFNRRSAIGFDAGMIELVNGFSYHDDPAKLGKCPLPRKSTMTQGTAVDVVPGAGASNAPSKNSERPGRTRRALGPNANGGLVARPHPWSVADRTYMVSLGACPFSWTRGRYSRWACYGP